MGIVYRQLVRLIGVFIQHKSNRYLTKRKRFSTFYFMLSFFYSALAILLFGYSSIV